MVERLNGIQEAQYSSFPHGGIAQLVERLNGIQEASGSNPLISTKSKIRAHLAPFLHDSDCGHLRFGKLPCPHIRKNAICNPSFRFGPHLKANLMSKNTACTGNIVRLSAYRRYRYFCMGE